MAPKAEKYSHGRDCKRLCCNRERYFPESSQEANISYPKYTLYALGAVALLSLATYCSKPKTDEDRQEESFSLVDRINKIN